MAGALVIIPGLLFLGTWVTMLLWNMLMPVIFGLTVITFWQALGLFVLARILFGGPPGGGHGRFPRKPRFKDREAWKDYMREHFADGFWGGSHDGRRPGPERPLSEEPDTELET